MSENESMRNKTMKRDEVQRKAFNKFVSNTLKSNSCPCKFDDLVDDMEDGLFLCHLVCSLQPKSKKTKVIQTIEEVLPEKNPRNIYQKISNLNSALAKLKADGCNLTNIGAEDLNKKNMKLCLAIIYRLALWYSGAEIGSNVVKSLIEFVNEVLQEHRSIFNVPDITNLTSDQQMISGQVFKVLNYHFINDDSKDKLSEFKSDVTNCAEHFDEAMDDARDLLDIPPILDGSMVNDLEEQAVTVQLLSYKEKMNQQGQEEILKKQKAKKFMDFLKSVAEAKNLDSNIDDVGLWAKNRGDELNSFSDQITAENLDKLSNFLNKHFNEDRPPKAVEKNNLENAFNDLCNNRKANGQPLPSNDSINSLNENWKHLLEAEKFSLSKLEDLKKNFANLEFRSRIFKRLCQEVEANSNSLASDSDSLIQRLQTIEIGKIDELEQHLEALLRLKSSTDTSLNELETYYNNKIVGFVQSEEFENNFTVPLNNCKSLAAESTKAADAAEGDCGEKLEKIKQVKENCKKNSFALYTIDKNNERAKRLLSESDSFLTLENLQDYKEELDKYSIDTNLANINECVTRNTQNVELTGSDHIINPYTNLIITNVLNDVESLKSEICAKHAQLESDRENLGQKEKDLESLNKSGDDLQSEINKTNEEIATLNEETDDAKRKEHCESLEANIIKFKATGDKLASDFRKYHEALNLNRQVQTMCEDLLSTVNHLKNFVRSTKNDDSEAQLTAEEKKKIETQFRKISTSQIASYEDFVPMVLQYAPLGMKITGGEKSVEIGQFFKKYGTGSESINLQQCYVGYGEYKENFYKQNKSSALSLINEKADNEGYISEANLKSISGGEFEQLIKNVEPVDRNNGKHYLVKELLHL